MQPDTTNTSRAKRADARRRDQLQALRESVRHLVLEVDRLRVVLAHDLGLSVHELLALGHMVVQDGITPKELARQLGVTPGSATGIVDRLETAGLVIRAPHPRDRRSVIVRLTPAGGHARAQAVAVLDHALTEACTHTGTNRIRDLTDLLTASSDLINRTTTTQTTS